MLAQLNSALQTGKSVLYSEHVPESQFVTHC